MKNILSLAPINKMAAIVTSKGVDWTPDCNTTTEEFIGPPPTTPKDKMPTNKNFIDLTGMKKGRFTVIGLLAGTGSKWVVRCSCGTYTTRNSSAIKKTLKDDRAHHDACSECMYLAHLKKREKWKATGKDANVEDYL